MPGTLAWLRTSLGGAAIFMQDGDTDEFVVFRFYNFASTVSKYYDYIVKCCSGIACDWCASLDIS